MLLEDTLAAGFAALGVTPDSGAAARYRIYFEHLEKMNAVMNLTAISGEEDVARLHFLDCAALRLARIVQKLAEGQVGFRHTVAVALIRQGDGIRAFAVVILDDGVPVDALPELRHGVCRAHRAVQHRQEKWQAVHLQRRHKA